MLLSESPNVLEKLLSEALLLLVKMDLNRFIQGQTLLLVPEVALPQALVLLLHQAQYHVELLLHVVDPVFRQVIFAHNWLLL